MGEKVRTVRLTPTITAVLQGETFLGIVEKGIVSYGEREWYAFAHREMVGPIHDKQREAIASLSTN